MPSEIPIGYCQCGCGQRTKVSKDAHPEREIAKGQPYKYVHGHGTRKHKAPLPSQYLCECGCGKYTPLAKSTNARLGKVQGQPQRFCRGHRKASVTTDAGFWKRVDVKGANECWSWLSYINEAGYGVTRTTNNKAVRASHIAYELTYGPLPDGMFVCHSCDNRACCNPAHLFAGTHTDNMHDMDKKGRRVNTPHYGESHGMSKLTKSQVLEIRRLAESGASFEELGRKFGISDVHAGRIVHRVSWAHVL